MNEPTTFIDVNGILTPILSAEQVKEIEQAQAKIIESIDMHLNSLMFFAESQSTKLAIIEVMRDFDHPQVVEHIRRFQDEL